MKIAEAILKFILVTTVISLTVIQNFVSLGDATLGECDAAAARPSKAKAQFKIVMRPHSLNTEEGRLLFREGSAFGFAACCEDGLCPSVSWATMA
jgi:hypothetical protein